MNIKDKALLQERLDNDQIFIKQQHRMSKSQRNTKELSRIRDRSDRIARWLKEP